MLLIISNEVIDTYVGDETFRNVYYVVNENNIGEFYAEHFGAKPKKLFLIDNDSELEYFKAHLMSYFIF